MSSLAPEVRPDKNGNLVTRHVKTDDSTNARALRVVGKAKPKSAVTPKHFDDPGYESAKKAFTDANPEDGDLFEEFFLGSAKTIEDAYGLIDNNTDIDAADTALTGLSNGYQAAWLNDEHLTLPSNQSVELDANGYKEALAELERLEELDYPQGLFTRSRNDIRVYAALHEITGTTDLESLMDAADHRFAGKYEDVSDFGESEFKAHYGFSSEEGMAELDFSINWDEVAADFEDDEDINTGEDAKAYYQQSIGSYDNLISYVDWEAVGSNFEQDYESYKGYYFRNN